EDGDLRPAARPGGCEDVRAAVAVDVARGNADSAREGRGGGEETGQRRAGAALSDGHFRPAALVGRGDDVRAAVPVDVGGRHERAAGEGCRQGEEVANQLKRLALEDADLRAAAGAGGADDVGHAVAVDVAHGHARAAGEGGCKGEEVGNQL